MVHPHIRRRRVARNRVNERRLMRTEIIYDPQGSSPFIPDGVMLRFTADVEFIEGETMKRHRITAKFIGKENSLGYVPDKTYTLDQWVADDMIWIQGRPSETCECLMRCPYSNVETFSKNWDVILSG